MNREREIVKRKSQQGIASQTDLLASRFGRGRKFGQTLELKLLPDYSYDGNDCFGYRCVLDLRLARWQLVSWQLATWLLVLRKKQVARKTPSEIFL